MKGTKNVTLIIISFVLIANLILVMPSYAIETKNLHTEAKSALLIEMDVGEILYEKNMNEKRYIASLTKIMTALLTLEAVENKEISMDDVLVMGKDIESVGGSSLYMTEGVSISVEELLKSMMILSANDSAYALAKHISGDIESFVERMNKKAKSIGAKNTIFYTPNGLPTKDGKENVSTAYDMYLICKELLTNYEDEITSITSMSYYKNKELDVVRLSTFKDLLKDIEGVDGLKTGYTKKAGFCLVTTMPVGRDTVKERRFRLISITLDSESPSSRANDHKKMLEYGKSNFKKILILRSREELGRISLFGNDDYQVKLIPGEDRTIMANGYVSIERVETNLNKNITTPIKYRDKLGIAKVYLDNGDILKVDLISDRNVNELEWVIRLKSVIKKIVNFFK